MKKDQNHNLPFLIVGQGLAGSLLAYFLLQKKYPFQIIDRPLPGATSSIAAGIINPITGRRMVKSWRFDELSQFAKKTYLEIEELLNTSIYQELNILRALPTTFDENEWDRRSEFPENKPFFNQSVEMAAYSGLVPNINYGELSGSSKVNLPELIRSFRNHFIEKGLLSETYFDFSKLETSAHFARYEGTAYRKIIFCEGHRARFNPFFQFLPFSPSKGELLLVKLPDLQAAKILKNKIYVVPLEKDLYWVGATNSFDCQSLEPTASQKKELTSALKKSIHVPFEIIDHQAGIRPTIADKRPLLGLHPQQPALAIFNGLGTKGASLGPYFAKQMAAFLMGRESLDPVVDIKRFS